MESLGKVTEDEFLEALQIHYNEKKAFKMLMGDASNVLDVPSHFKLWENYT